MLESFFFAALNGELMFTCIFGVSVFTNSVAPLIRLGGWYLYLHIRRLFLNLTVKTALKSID